MTQRLVRFSTDPEPMQENSKFSCYTNCRSLFRILSSALAQHHSKSSQIAVRPERSEDVVGTAHQQFA